MADISNSRCCLAASVLLLLILFDSTMGKTIYVDDDATGANDGSGWENAYVYLQDALVDANSAEKPVEIQVAQGIYKPDQGANQTPGDREATFQLISSVALKGGYAGLSEPDPDARDVELYETILSGDLNSDDIKIDDVEVDGPWDLAAEPTRAENSYHVITGSGTDDSAILDGFTITSGNANGPKGPKDDPYKFKSGAGMCNYYGSPSVVNCTFTGNSAYGAGGLKNESANPTVVNCTFSRNSGRGMVNSNSSLTLTDCIFTGNSDSGMGNGESSLIITNCTFIENHTIGDGGGIFNEWTTMLKLTDCTFVRNYARYNGGGMEGGIATLTNCAFIANDASQAGGLSSDCSNLISCNFIANKAMYWGGGLWSWDDSTIFNCTFRGNSAGFNGGAIYTFDSDLILANCTLTGNSAPNGRALSCDKFHQAPSNIELTNCILWNGNNEVWNNDGSTITISYSDIRSGQAGIYNPCGVVVWEQGNINADPLFANPGYWVDVNDPNVIVEPNDPNNELWVDGDYHLKSQAGRWDPVSENWVIDDITSPCIDAGDPNRPIAFEPFPNGGIINMGAYGGTAEASKSSSGIHNEYNGCTSLTTNEMQDIITFLNAGQDLNNEWVIKEGDYPRLRWETEDFNDL